MVKGALGNERRALHLARVNRTHLLECLEGSIDEVELEEIPEVRVECSELVVNDFLVVVKP